jgi:hypothetical protein
MESVATHILPLTLIRRRRLLPFPGRVLVNHGQNVSAADIVADARQPGSHFLVDVRRDLGLARISDAEKLITHVPGDRIEKGEVLAQTGGLFAQTLRSPATGIIITISAGRIMIETEGSAVNVRAGVAGLVREILPNFGAVIETSGALVQGRIGNGQVDQGMMLVAARTPLDELSASRLDVSMRGAVLVGGYCVQADALRMAGELSLRGLILSSIAPELLPIVKQAEYPILVVEGYGKLPFCQEAYQIFTTNEKRDACVNASVYDPFTGVRPELVVNLPGIGELANDVVEFSAGQTVRILTTPYASQSGTLVQIRPGKTRLKNGIHVLAGDVRLENNEVVSIPLANLDVLE